MNIGTPHTSGAGYFVNDKDLKSRQEDDIQTCSHCQAILKMREWVQKGAFCHKCMKPVCVACGKRMQIYGCENFMRKIDLLMDATVKYQQHLKIVGV